MLLLFFSCYSHSFTLFTLFFCIKFLLFLQKKYKKKDLCVKKKWMMYTLNTSKHKDKQPCTDSLFFLSFLFVSRFRDKLEFSLSSFLFSFLSFTLFFSFNGIHKLYIVVAICPWLFSIPFFIRCRSLYFLQSDRRRY